MLENHRLSIIEIVGLILSSHGYSVSPQMRYPNDGESIIWLVNPLLRRFFFILESHIILVKLGLLFYITPQKVKL